MEIASNVWLYAGCGQDQSPFFIFEILGRGEVVLLSRFGFVVAAVIFIGFCILIASTTLLLMVFSMYVFLFSVTFISHHQRFLRPHPKTACLQTRPTTAQPRLPLRHSNCRPPRTVSIISLFTISPFQS